MLLPHLAIVTLLVSKVSALEEQFTPPLPATASAMSDYNSVQCKTRQVPQSSGTGNLVNVELVNNVGTDAEICMFGDYGYESSVKDLPAKQTKWGCFIGDKKIDQVSIWWGHTSTEGTWACNQWRSACQGKCSSKQLTTYECTGKFPIQGYPNYFESKPIASVDLWWGDVEDGKWACNQWIPACNKQCEASWTSDQVDGRASFTYKQGRAFNIRQKLQNLPCKGSIIAGPLSFSASGEFHLTGIKKCSLPPIIDLTPFNGCRGRCLSGLSWSAPMDFSISHPGVGQVQVSWETIKNARGSLNHLRDKVYWNKEGIFKVGKDTKLYEFPIKNSRGINTSRLIYSVERNGKKILRGIIDHTPGLSNAFKKMLKVPRAAAAAAVQGLTGAEASQAAAVAVEQAVAVTGEVAAVAEVAAGAEAGVTMASGIAAGVVEFFELLPLILL